MSFEILKFITIFTQNYLKYAASQNYLQIIKLRIIESTYMQ